MNGLVSPDSLHKHIQLREQTINKPVTKQNIVNSVGSQFKHLIDRGYIFTVRNLHEYVGSRNMGGLIGLDLPKNEWDRIYNISMRHNDYDHNEYSWPLEVTITDSSIRREIRMGNLYIDPNRRKRGEGKEMIVALAHVAQEFGFDRIRLSGGPYLPNEKNDGSNILDWYSRNFPKLGNLRERVEKDPAEAFILITDILEV